MTSTDWQGSSLGSGLTFPPSPHYNPTFGSFDLVSSPVWWETETNIGLCCPGWPQSKTESKQKNKGSVPRPCSRIEKTDTNCNWHVLYSRQRIDAGTGSVGNKKTSWNHQNYSIAEIGQYTKKSPGDRKRLAITQNLMKFYELTSVWKTHNNNNNNNPISTIRPDQVEKKKTERICRIVDFAAPVDHMVKLKEGKKRDKYLDLAWKLKKKNYGTWKWRWYRL